MRLSLGEALALFLKQNLDLLIAKYGIESNKGQQITARLLPNPTLQVGNVASFTQGTTPPLPAQLPARCSSCSKRPANAVPRGKRRLRVQSSEADFEDAVRQLSFAVKDAYFRVQLAQRRLALAEENRDRFARILDVNTIRFKKGYIAEIDLIRIRLQMVDFQSQVIGAIQEAESARADLRQLLRISAGTRVELTTELDYRRVDPDIGKLRFAAIQMRPDIRSKRSSFSQREADLKLAKAYRFPDVTVGAGYSVQGPRGPDNQQMGLLNFGVPLPCSTGTKVRSSKPRWRCNPLRRTWIRPSIKRKMRSRWPITTSCRAGGWSRLTWPACWTMPAPPLLSSSGPMSGRGHDSGLARCRAYVPDDSTELYRGPVFLPAQPVSIGECRRAGGVVMTLAAARLLMTLSVCTVWSCSQTQEPTTPGTSSEPATGAVQTAAGQPASPIAGQVETAVVQLKPVQPELVLVGKVAYGEDRYSKISSPLQGRVVEVRAHLGDRVKAGDTLLVIDSPDITAAYSEFVKEASDLEYATRAQELAKELYATKALALKDLKQAENDLIKARAEFRRAKERLLSLRISASELDKPLAQRASPHASR
ncbi:MAG: TolC family protein [Nitrospiraceae bacterium]